MKKIYGIVSWRGERKAMSMLEFIVCITVCAVAVFGWSEDMNSNQILPKQYYTLMAVSVAVIVLAVRTFRQSGWTCCVSLCRHSVLVIPIWQDSDKSYLYLPVDNIHGHNYIEIAYRHHGGISPSV